MSVATVEAVDGADVVATLAAADALGVTQCDPMAWAFRELIAYAQVMTWSGWSDPWAWRVATGSELVAALEMAYEAVRREVDDLPEVIIITGSGRTGYGLKWGHFAPERWRDALASGRKPEVFVGGERLATGAVMTMQTLLHECAHILAFVRDIKDTSRQHRYHNGEFLKLAETLGLSYEHDGPDGTIGYSAVTLTESGKRRWAWAIDQLDAAITMGLEMPGFDLSGLLGLLGGAGGHGVALKGGGRGTGGTSGVKFVCPECERIVRMSRSQSERGPVGCGNEDDHPADAPAFVVMVEA